MHFFSISVRTSLLLVILFLSGCRWGSGIEEIDSGDPAGMEIIPISVDDARTVNMSKIFSEISYVPLETTGGEVITNPGKLVYQDGMYFIMYEGNIFTFDESGKFLQELVIPRGIGTGQITDPIDFIVHPGSNEISVYGMKRINRYSFDGELVDEFIIRAPVVSLGAAPNGDYVLNIGNHRIDEPDVQNTDYNLLYMNMEREVYKRVFKIEDEVVNTRYPVVKNFTTYKDTLLYFAHPDYNIYELGEEEVRVRYRLDFGDDAIPEEMLEERPDKQTGMTFNEMVLDQEYAAFPDMFFETDGLVSFTFMNNIEAAAHRAFYSKESGETLVADLLINDIDYGLAPYFMEVKGNELISLVHSGDIIQVANYIRDELSPSELEAYMQREQNLIDLAETLTEFDNPVLMFARTKGF